MRGEEPLFPSGCEARRMERLLMLYITEWMSVTQIPSCKVLPVEFLLQYPLRLKIQLSNPGYASVQPGIRVVSFREDVKF
jgi:hypothetical protein